MTFNVIRCTWFKTISSNDSGQLKKKLFLNLNFDNFLIKCLKFPNKISWNIRRIIIDTVPWLSSMLFFHHQKELLWTHFTIFPIWDLLSTTYKFSIAQCMCYSFTIFDGSGVPPQKLIFGLVLHTKQWLLKKISL